MDYFTVQRQRPEALTEYSRRVAALLPNDIAPAARKVFVEGLQKMYLTDFLVPEFLIRFADKPVEMAVLGTAEAISRVWHDSSVPGVTIPALYASQLLATEWLDFLDRTEHVVATHSVLSEAMSRLPKVVIERVGISQGETEQFAAALQHFICPAQLH